MYNLRDSMHTREVGDHSTIQVHEKCPLSPTQEQAKAIYHILKP